MKRTSSKPAGRKRGNVTSIDFTGVESGGATVPDGRYAAKLLEVDQLEGKESGEPYLEVTWEITSHKCQGRKIKFDNYSLQPQALWRLKGMLEALGVNVVDGAMDIDWDDLIKDEEECILEIVGKEGNDGDRKYARVVGIAPLSDGGTVDDEADDPPARGKERPRAVDRSRRDEGDGEDGNDRRSSRRPRDDDNDDNKPRGANKRLKKGAEVKFRDEKGKLKRGEITDINKDTITVETDDQEVYELETDEVTVVG